MHVSLFLNILKKVLEKLNMTKYVKFFKIIPKNAETLLRNNVSQYIFFWFFWGLNIADLQAMC